MEIQFAMRKSCRGKSGRSENKTHFLYYATTYYPLWTNGTLRKRKKSLTGAPLLYAASVFLPKKRKRGKRDFADLKQSWIDFWFVICQDTEKRLKGKLSELNNSSSNNKDDL